MAKSPRKRRQLVPVGYGFAALVAVAALLPSALRPPPDETSQSAALSADAPPEDDPDTIIQSVQQAGSRTAGGVTVAATTIPPPPPPPPRVIRTKGQCYGNPPRQTDSPYAGPCVEVFHGDNGGATSKGVTADEIRFIIWQGADGGDGIGYRGRVPDSPQSGESEEARTLRVYQAYFNKHFEFYGRKLQFIIDPEDGQNDAGNPTANRAHVVDTDKKYGGLFAAWSNEGTSMLAGADSKIVTIGGINLEHDFYASRRPYLYGFNMDGSKLVRLNAEYLCKRLQGPARYAGDPAYREQPRKFGLIYNNGGGAQSGFSKLAAVAKARCGIEILAREIGFLAAENDNGRTANAIAAFKLGGITSVIVATDPIAPATITNTAEAQQYFPEWIISGMWQIDDSAIPGLFGYSVKEWQNAFGLSPREFRPTDQDTDWYKAYKDIDPAGTPNASNASNSWPHFMMIANGIQGAGPNLTPETFRDALMALPHRNPDPPQFMCCGFGPNDLTYSDMVNEIYFDESGFATDCSICKGTYIYPECGTRYGEGMLPETPADVFNGGCRLPGDGRSTGPPPKRSNP